MKKPPMLFNSLNFFIFFPTITFLYFLIPHKYRWFLLLTASSVFYMSFIPKYILILLLTIAVDYTAGIYIEKASGQKKKRLLAISVIVTVAVLFVFKYFNFFQSNAGAIAEFFHWNYGLKAFDILLPIGLSFHTFQSLSYVIEVYRGNQKAEHHFGIYALYVMFYPQLVAGPIERPQNLLHQFYEKHVFDYNRIAEGLGLMLWGFFKKMVIADNAAGLVNVVYNNPEGFAGVHFILATILFSFQIFCDFSGYSDIAVGAAKIMGFDLMKNFNRPYSAVSIADFWRRWHISLSSWFRDYVYIPLGGSRAGTGRTYRNILIAFLLSGLWHGANWTFVAWGAIHGLYIIIGKITKRTRQAIAEYAHMHTMPRLYGFLQTGVTFLLVSFAWIFFRANSLSDAWYIVSNLLSGVYTLSSALPDLHRVKDVLGQFEVAPAQFAFIWISLLFLLAAYWFKKDSSVRQALLPKPVFVRWGFYYLLLFSILFFGNLGEQPFIYFQF